MSVNCLSLPGLCSYAHLAHSNASARSCVVAAVTPSFKSLPGTAGRLVQARGCAQDTRQRVLLPDMASTIEDFSLHLLRNCKTIHLVRHGQGYHNVAGEIDYSIYGSYEYFDA
eukprot:c19369_g1_i2 orf=3-338(-)